jgi:hypothetical protein
MVGIITSSTYEVNRDLLELREVVAIIANMEIVDKISECNLPDKQTRLAMLMSLWRFDDIPSIFPEIEVAERRETRIGQGCMEYVFGKRDSYFDVIEKIIDTRTEVADFLEGDVIVYFNEIGKPTHVGKGTNDGRVVSKWGKGHVFIHDKNDVPLAYGAPKGYRANSGLR